MTTILPVRRPRAARRRRPASRALAPAAFLLAGLLTAGAGCGARDERAEAPAVIGVVLPLSGPDAPTGEAILRGLELAAADSSGLPPVVLRILDGEGRPSTSRRQRLALDRDPAVVAVVAGAFAATGRGTAAPSLDGAEADEAPVLLLSPLAAPHAGLPGPGPARLHSLEALGAAAAAFARDDAGAAVAGVIDGGGGEASRILADAFLRVWEDAGGQVAWRIVPEEDSGALRLPPGPEETVEVVWVAGPAAIAPAAAGLGSKTGTATILVPGGWGRAELVPLVAAGRVVRIVDFWCPGDSAPAARAFLEACQAKGIEPGSDVATGWDAGMRLRAALERAGADRRALARELVDGPPDEGASGRLGSRWADGGEDPAISALTMDGDVFLRRVPAPAVPRPESGKPPATRDSAASGAGRSP